MNMEKFSKDSSNLRANKVKPGGGEGQEELKDLVCFRCGEKGHFSHSCPIKREDAIALIKALLIQTGTLLKHVGIKIKN